MSYSNSKVIILEHYFHSIHFVAKWHKRGKKILWPMWKVFTVKLRDTFCSFVFLTQWMHTWRGIHWLHFTGGIIIRCCLAEEVGRASLACSSAGPNVYVGAGTDSGQMPASLLEATGMRSCLLLQQKWVKEGWVFSTFSTGGGFWHLGFTDIKNLHLGLILLVTQRWLDLSKLWLKGTVVSRLPSYLRYTVVRLVLAHVSFLSGVNVGPCRSQYRQ